MTNGSPASTVFGQDDFSTKYDGTGANEFHLPMGIDFYQGKMVVADNGNGRILIFNSPNSSKSANNVIGWNSMGAGVPTQTCNQDTFYPGAMESIFITPGGKLILTDAGNNRVLVWNTIPSVDGVKPDLVLGHPNFTTCDAGTSATKFNWPSDVWSDDEKLIIVDSENHRVLFYNTFPTSSSAVPDLILGQADANSAVSGTTSSSFNSPYRLDVLPTKSGHQLFLVDGVNSRILIWNNLPNSAFTPADVVLGQSDFNHGTHNDDDQDNVQDSHPSARTLKSWGSGIHIHPVSKKLFVSDSLNNRVLIFQGQ